MIELNYRLILVTNFDDVYSFIGLGKLIILDSHCLYGL